MKGLDQLLKQNSPLNRARNKDIAVPDTDNKIKFTSLMRRKLFLRWKEQTIREKRNDPARRDYHVLEDALTEYLNRHES